jgi:putative transposase
VQYHLNWQTLSVKAGITLWSFCFRLYPGAIRTPQIVTFLEHRLRHIPGKLLGRQPTHRRRVVQDFVAAQKGRIHTKYLLAHAPELNPRNSSGATASTTNFPTPAPSTSSN